MSDEADEKTPYEEIGGAETINRLVDSLYDRMESLPEARTIRDMHAADMKGIRLVFKLYLTEWLGGPDVYSSRRGHPRLRARHMPFSIGAAERDQWLLCMRGALDATIENEAIRNDIFEAMSRLADHMRNRAEG